MPDVQVEEKKFVPQWAPASQQGVNPLIVDEDGSLRMPSEEEKSYLASIGSECPKA